jgi:hypothetical protein
MPRSFSLAASIHAKGDVQMVVKRVGPVSCAKIAGIIYAVMGLCFGAMFSLFAIAGVFTPDRGGFGGLGAIMGVGAIIALPIFYGVMGFVTSLIGAWLYNLVAGVAGGVELDVQ